MSSNPIDIRNAENLSFDEIKELDAAQKLAIRELQFDKEKLEMELDLQLKDLQRIDANNSKNDAYNHSIVIEQLEAAANEKGKIVLEMEDELAQTFPQQLVKCKLDKMEEMSSFTKNVEELCNLFLDAPGNYESEAMTSQLKNVMKLQMSIKNELNVLASDLAAMKDTLSLDVPIKTSKLTELRNVLKEEEKKKEEQSSVNEQLKREEESLTRIAESLKKEIMQLKNLK